MSTAAFFLLFLVVVIYFIPTLISNSRKHYLLWPTFVINLFLGVTLVGWVIALAMAVWPHKS